MLVETGVEVVCRWVFVWLGAGGVVVCRWVPGSQVESGDGIGVLL